MRMPDFTPCWPGLASSLHLESSERRALLRKRSVPSRRASLHFGPVYRAPVSPCQILRRFGGRQPLCGTGVTSVMLEIFMPSAFRARTADSRPGPGPLMRTSRFFTPPSGAARPAASAATCAANGVDLREPLKPAPPDVAHDSALPWRSVIVMIVLLKDAWMCAIPSVTFFLTFLRALATVAFCDGCCAIFYVPSIYALVTPLARATVRPFFGPLRVRAFVRVRWPRTGRP